MSLCFLCERSEGGLLYVPCLVLVVFAQSFERKVARFVAGMRQPGETGEAVSFAAARDASALRLLQEQHPEAWQREMAVATSEANALPDFDE